MKMQHLLEKRLIVIAGLVLFSLTFALGLTSLSQAQNNPWPPGKSLLVPDMKEIAADQAKAPAYASGSSSAAGQNSMATAGTLSCREGLAGWEPYLSAGIDIRSLGGGSYLDFYAHAPAPQLNALEFMQRIQIRQNKDSQGNYLQTYTITPTLSDAAGGLGPVIASAPGALWLVGNEPDRGPDVPGGPAQDDTFPQIYARVYHDVYQFIKQRDPSAQIAMAGLVEVTPGRLQYQDIVWNTYVALYGQPMPVDVWNIHLYVLPETVGIANVALGTDPALAYGFAFTHTNNSSNIYTYGDHDNLSLFDSQVRRMRQWMKAHGQQDKPLLLSEFGLLYDEDVTDEFGKNFTEARATAFLTKTFNYLSTTSDPSIGMLSDGNRLVQQWIWFSTNHTIGHISNLVTNTMPLTFTSVGNMFRANVATRPLQPNFQTRFANAATPILQQGQSSVTATLSVEFVNNGNQPVTAPLTVTFYADEALTQVINSVVVTGGVPGCARRPVTASILWPNRGPGIQLFWAKVDAANAFNETNETDNVIQGQVFVGTHGVYLPFPMKSFP